MYFKIKFKFVHNNFALILMLRMKCSACWVYYDIPHIYLFSELDIISYEIIENVEKNQIN